MEYLNLLLYRISVVSFIFIFAFGCGDNDKPTAKASRSINADTEIVVGVTLMTTSNPFFVILGEAAKKEAAAHDLLIKEVLSGENAENQANQIRDFITQAVNAIVIAPNDHFAVGEAIKQANQAGIPVFTADTGCSDPSAEVVSNVMTDNYGGGLLAGEAMIGALGPNGGGKVLILSFDSAQSCLLRVKGFKIKIEEYNQANSEAKIEIVAELPGQAEQDASKKATEDALNAYEDLAGIFAINDPSALGAVVAVHNAKKQDKIKIIGFDGQPIGKQAIRKGDIYADPIQFPKEIGRKVVQQIAKYLNGDPVEKEILIPAKLYFQADAENDPEAQ